MSAFSRPFNERMADYVRSPQFTDIPDYSLSEYWKHFHDEIKIAFNAGNVSVDGKSGYYVPRRHTPLSILRRILTSKEDRATARLRLVTHFSRTLGLTEYLSAMPYREAFDAIMQRKPVADVERSIHRIDFDKLLATPETFISSNAVRRDYVAASKGVEPNSSIYRIYYLYNILNYFAAFDSNFSFLEIGGGSGNLAALMLRKATKTSYMVDLPRTTCGAVDYIRSMHPTLKFLLPNEAESMPHSDADLIFLTPGQIALVPSASVKLVVNVDSFQEMTRKQVAEYFDLADRVIEPGGLFFVNNRVEKISMEPDAVGTSQSDLMRIQDFPWREGAKFLANEVCRLSRLTQRDNAILMLEKR